MSASNLNPAYNHQHIKHLFKNLNYILTNPRERRRQGRGEEETGNRRGGEREEERRRQGRGEEETAKRRGGTRGRGEKCTQMRGDKTRREDKGTVGEK